MDWRFPVHDHLFGVLQNPGLPDASILPKEVGHQLASGGTFGRPDLVSGWLLTEVEWLSFGLASLPVGLPLDIEPQKF